jgi:hypothetical protein
VWLRRRRIAWVSQRGEFKLSADNGIYVAIFGDGKIRVTEAGGIDNCWNREDDTENALAIVEFFGDAREFENDSLTDAFVYAREVEQEIIADMGFTEYGVQSFHFQHPFSYYLAEASTIQHNEEPYDVESELWEHTDA